MPSKSNDAVEAALSRAVDDIQALVRASGASAPVVLIDGRSGAGKTSLSRRLAVSRRDAYVLALDSVYPGWDGLRAGADHVIDNVLTPRVRGAEGSWNGWNWQLDVPETASHVVPLHGTLIVEGAGIVTATSAVLADVRVWVEAADADRKRRALTRDGDTYAPHWERWARQEDQHIAANDPRSLSDIVVVVPTD